MLLCFLSLRSSVAATSQVTERKEGADAALTFYNKGEKQTEWEIPTHKASLPQISARTLAYFHRVANICASSEPKPWSSLLFCQHALRQRDTEGKEAPRPGWKCKGDTEPRSLQHPHTLQLLCSLHCGAVGCRSVAFPPLSGLGCPYTWLAPKAAPLLRLPQPWPHTTSSCGKPDISPHSLPSSLTEGWHGVILLPPQRFLCL